MNDSDRDQATGWLHASIERERPGFLAQEAKAALIAGYPGIASVLQAWADEEADFSDRMRHRLAAARCQEPS